MEYNIRNPGTPSSNEIVPRDYSELTLQCWGSEVIIARLSLAQPDTEAKSTMPSLVWLAFPSGSGRMSSISTNQATPSPSAVKL